MSAPPLPPPVPPPLPAAPAVPSGARVDAATPAPAARIQPGATRMDIDTRDVLLIVHQFLVEVGLGRTAETLLAEADIGANALDADAVAALLANVTAGRWDAALPVLAGMQLPPRILMDVYEQVVRELVELREVDAARALMRDAVPFALMRREEPTRASHLDALLVRAQALASGATKDASGLHAFPDGASKSSRREELARQLRECVLQVQPSRLLSLLGDAMKWHAAGRPSGLPSGRFDVLRGCVHVSRDAEDALPRAAGATLRFGSTRAGAAVFLPDGSGLVCGSADGLIEVYESSTSRLREDLTYQAADEFMMHDDAVTALAVSRDSALLASGSRDNSIKVWALATGDCIRKFPRAHGDGSTTALAFTRDGGQLLSGGDDGLLRLHGLRSGKLLREFRGHTSIITSVAFGHDGVHIVSASADGTVRVWDSHTAECIHIVRPPQATATADAAISTVLILPRTPDHMLVVPRSDSAYVMNASGAVLRTLSAPRRGCAFVTAAVSTHGKFAYCVADDGHMIAFHVGTGKHEACALEPQVMHGGLVLGAAHHPLRNIVATWGGDCTLQLWKS